MAQRSTVSAAARRLSTAATSAITPDISADISAEAAVDAAAADAPDVATDVPPDLAPTAVADAVPPLSCGDALPPPWRQALFDRLLHGFFSQLIQGGSLELVDAAGRTSVFGTDQEPRVRVRLHDPHLSQKLVLNPGLAIGEAYMDGTFSIEVGDLQSFLRLCAWRGVAVRRHPLQQMRRQWQTWARYPSLYNPVRRAVANVHHHYDLSDALYALFLDSDRQYSCAYFHDGDETLDEAQEKKKRHLAAKLLLQPDMSVVDIGCGWGGLALHLAGEEKVSVTGLTLSEEQYKVARRRALEAGLSRQVEFRLRDYRHETGVYDRVVSVGMFEHVGPPHYEQFFAAVRRMLNDDGLGVVHSIGRNGPPGYTNPWIDKYIFPGAYAPAISEVLRAVERSGLWVTDIEILREHYADTLHHWWLRFQAARDRALLLYDERFCRMWEFYLASTEAAFREGPLMVFQLQLARNRHCVPRHRDYIAEHERQRAAAAPT
jgi:cyclopropane-fatty-acyl-phospholipid synthase